MSKIILSKSFINNSVKLALNEDLYPSGDITSDLIKNNKIIEAKLISNQNAVIGGLLFVKYTFSLIDKKIKFIVKKKDGSFSKCGRSKQKADAKRKYPKCVPLAKARRMTESQRRSAVSRKRAVAQGVGGKPTNVKTFAKRQKAMMGGFMARRMGMR